jgi:uncharacterized cupredoxin-like copper-binding protein
MAIIIEAGRVLRRRMVLASLLLGAGVPVLAHQEHAKHKTAAPRKEQKPWGIAGDAHAVKRTIEITMSDAMRFRPDSIDVKQGEVVRFVVRNSGKLLHELVIGTKKELDEHAALMMKFPNMEHEEPYMTHVAPGKQGELIWRFNRRGEFRFACLVDGHYQAGMVGRIKVSAA